MEHPGKHAPRDEAYEASGLGPSSDPSVRHEKNPLREQGLLRAADSLFFARFDVLRRDYS
jgi:hypothetical protein